MILDIRKDSIGDDPFETALVKTMCAVADLLSNDALETLAKFAVKVLESCHVLLLLNLFLYGTGGWGEVCG